MPCTTGVEDDRAIIILISEMKPSPSGLSAVPVWKKVTDEDADSDGDQHLM
jgi:hypothetical protein